MGGPLSLKQHSSIQVWSVAIECVSTQISTGWNVETLGSASRVTEQRWSRCGVCVCVSKLMRYSPAHSHYPDTVWTIFYQPVNGACFMEARHRKTRVNDHAIHGSQLTFFDSTSKATLTLVNYFTSGRAFLQQPAIKTSIFNSQQWIKGDRVKERQIC